MKEYKKVISAIVIVVMVIFLISGGTLAYWQWATSSTQNTLVNVTLTDEARMHIDFPSEDITHMYPTSDCEVNGTSSWVTEITVNNGTGVVLSPNFKLKVRILDKNGNAITNTKNTGNSQPNRYYVKYAVTGVNESCQNALITGRFDQSTQTVSGNNTWFDSSLITLYDDDTGFPIVSGKNGSGVSFYAHPNMQTKQRFKVYVWLDKNYTSVNVGGTVSDTMQDAKVTVSWSENSELEQVKRAPKTGEAIAIYSADDNSLRFYREDDPSSISVGSTYNGRAVTNVYTDFEIDYSLSVSPWNEIASNIFILEFEDYVYPVSTKSWFANMGSVRTADLSKLDTFKVNDMSYMFSNSGFAGEIYGLELWDTSSVVNMNSMFKNGYVPDIDGIENWDTSNVIDMTAMFNSSLHSMIDLSGWNVCNVTEYDGFAVGSSSMTSPYFGDTSRCNGGLPA